MNPTVARPIAPVSLESLPPYSPTTYLDFSQPANRAAFEAALTEVRASFGRDYPIVIGGQRETAAKYFDSTNPAKPSEVLGRFASGTAEQAARAVEAAYATFATWSRVPAATISEPPGPAGGGRRPGWPESSRWRCRSGSPACPGWPMDRFWCCRRWPRFWCPVCSRGRRPCSGTGMSGAPC